MRVSFSPKDIDRCAFKRPYYWASKLLVWYFLFPSFPSFLFSFLSFVIPLRVFKHIHFYISLIVSSWVIDRLLGWFHAIEIVASPAINKGVYMFILYVSFDHLGEQLMLVTSMVLAQFQGLWGAMGIALPDPANSGFPAYSVSLQDRWESNSSTSSWSRSLCSQTTQCSLRTLKELGKWRGVIKKRKQEMTTYRKNFIIDFHIVSLITIKAYCFHSFKEFSRLN